LNCWRWTCTMNVAIQRWGDQVLKAAGRGHWLGNGKLLQGERWRKLEESNPAFRYANDGKNLIFLSENS
jgi:hypothetical protein